MTVLLSLFAALSAGTSDFLGGLGSRRTPAIAVTAVSQLAGFGFAMVFAFAVGGEPTGADLWWGALGGLGGGLGLLSIYEGYAKASVTIAAPLAGVGAAAVPVGFDVVTGDGLDLVTGIGIACGLIAIGLVSLQSSEVDAPVRLSLLYGLGGALGLGFLLLCLGQASDDGGIWPVAPARFTGFVCMAVALRATVTSPRVPRSVVPIVLGIGVLGTGANAFFVTATQRGSISTAAVLTAMFPAVTVLWARAVFKEKLRVVQVIGLGLALIAVGLIAGS